MGVAFGCGETEDYFVAIVIVPVEGGVPAVGHGIVAIHSVEDILRHGGTVGIMVFAHIHLGIEVEAHQQSGGGSLSPLALNRRVGAEAGFLDEQAGAVFKLGFDEGEHIFGSGLRIVGHVAVSGHQGHIAESVEQADIEPCTQGAALGFEVVEFKLCEAEAFGIEFVEVLDYEVALHYALEAAVPFGLGFAEVVDGPCMIVEAFPFAAVVPPTVARGGDELVGGELVEDVAAADAPERMFEGAESGADYVHFRIVVVFRPDLVVERLVEVGAGSERYCRSCCHCYIFKKFHF